jgi:polar amino acid transport system ATP-binding protein
MTLLMVTHEIDCARKVSNRVLFMHQGRVHEMGPPAELFGNLHPPTQADYVITARLSCTD